MSEEKKLRMSVHCWRRMAQRNLTLSDVLVALKCGRRIHRAQADFWFLGYRDCPSGLERLEGLTVVVERNCIKTCYRNRHAIGKLKKKPRRYHGCFNQMPIIAQIVHKSYAA
jgi:hypothetical protein